MSCKSLEQNSILGYERKGKPAKLRDLEMKKLGYHKWYDMITITVQLILIYNAEEVSMEK